MKNNMKNLNPIFDEYEPRIKRPSYFRMAITDLIVLVGFVGFMAMIFATAYFGIGAGIKQMDIQQCKDYKNYEAQYPDSISEEQINKCNIIGIEI